MAAIRKGGRKFKKTLGSSNQEDLKQKRYAKNSEKKVHWALKSYTVWYEACIEIVRAEFCDSDILSSDLKNPQLLEKEKLCAALCKFVTEI